MLPSRLRIMIVLLAIELFPAAAPLAGQRYENVWVDITPADKRVLKEWEPSGQKMKIWGGLVVHPGLKSVLAGPMGKGMVVDLFLKVSNESPNPLWLEMEIDVPGQEKDSVKSAEIKNEHWRWEMWTAKDLQWGVPYPVKISAYSDKKKSNSLGSMTGSLVFDDADKATLEQAKTQESEALRGAPNRFLFVAFSGWGKLSDEELAAAKKKEEVKEEMKAQLKKAMSDQPPPFEWKESEGSPGVSLTATEAKRVSEKGGTLVIFDLNATGFATGEDLTLWKKWLDGKYSQMSDLSVDKNGHIQIKLADKSAPIAVGVREMAAGEPIGWLLASAATGKRAYARAVIVPIEAHSAGGCSASAELGDTSGLLFHVSYRGFAPGEEVEISREFKKEIQSSPSHADDKGALDLPVSFGAGDHGKAIAKAAGKGCAVSLEYNVGPDALVKR
ncbi:MAG: hypothetical protein WCA49_04750 [Candidatus Sulfotelmatobacter sp.]